jgi:hypothetical protein
MRYRDESMISLPRKYFGATVVFALFAITVAAGCKKDPDIDILVTRPVVDLGDGGIGVNVDTGRECAEIGADGSQPAPPSNIGGTKPGDPPCNGDWGSGATAACATRGQGFCSAAGLCTTCGDCSSPPRHSGTVCSPDGLCGASCSDAAPCPAGQFCSKNGATGACVPVHSNGESLGTEVFEERCTPRGPACAAGVAHVENVSCRCGKAHGEPCTTDAECMLSFCAPDGKCGRRVGDACHPPPDFAVLTPNPCRSGTCDSKTCSCVAACASDATCGNTQSGRVCDPVSGICIDGCRTSGGNGCPLGKTCQMDGGTIGGCR